MKPQVIGEPAIYWHGDLNLLHQMIQVAAATQCDYFKLQCFDTKYLTGKFKAKKKFYNLCQLSDGNLVLMKNTIEQLGMKLLCTVMTPDQLDRLAKLNVDSIKIASGQICMSLIDAINKHAWKEVFVSTGMLDDVKKLDMLHTIDCARVNVLHCVSLYPQYDCETNINRMLTLREYLDSDLKPTDKKYHYGYSDHAADDLGCMVAACMGAEYIERHFKIDGCFGPTSQVCCDPAELGNLTALLRRIDIIKGDGGLLMQPREQESWNHYKNRFIF